MDPRIKTETVTFRTTPDGRRHETDAAAESHLRYLDEQARKERVMTALREALWDLPDEVRARFDYSDDLFAEGMYDIFEGHRENLGILASILPRLEEAWAGKPAEPVAEPAPVPPRGTGRRPR